MVGSTKTELSYLTNNLLLASIAMTHAGITLIATYDVRLVVLSVVIAITASYTALDLAGRVTKAQGHVRQLWLAGGAKA